MMESKIIKLEQFDQSHVGAKCIIRQAYGAGWMDGKVGTIKAVDPIQCHVVADDGSDCWCDEVEILPDGEGE